MHTLTYQNTDFETAIKLNPDNRLAHVNKACFEYINFFHDIVKQGNATIDSNEVIHLRPKDRRLVEKAARKVEPLMKKFSELAEPFRQYANIMHEQRNYEQADKHYRMAIEREPKNGKLMAKLAWNHMLWKEKDYETPFKILSEAVKIDPSCEEAFNRFSKLEFKQ
jgi:tetratricopeptide (TPR) repeat protein